MNSMTKQEFLSAIIMGVKIFSCIIVEGLVCINFPVNHSLYLNQVTFKDGLRIGKVKGDLTVLNSTFKYVSLNKKLVEGRFNFNGNEITNRLCKI